MENLNISVNTLDANWMAKAQEELRDKGVVVLYNIASEVQMTNTLEQVKKILSKPSVYGSYGFYRKDPYKKMYDGFLISKDIVEIIANEKILRTIENYIDDKPIITEVMLKEDHGDNLIYFPYHRHTGEDLDRIEDRRFGCGVMLYLHDTNEGAFCYSLGSHKIPIDINVYLLSDEKNKAEVEKNLRRINGKAGSIVIFDECGYHGPEQPTTKKRAVILSGYQSQSMTSNRTRTEIPVIISHLSGLTKYQLSSIGLGGSSRSNFKNYHYREVEKSKKHLLLVKYGEILFFLEKRIMQIKKNLFKI